MSYPSYIGTRVRVVVSPLPESPPSQDSGGYDRNPLETPGLSLSDLSTNVKREDSRCFSSLLVPEVYLLPTILFTSISTYIYTPPLVLPVSVDGSLGPFILLEYLYTFCETLSRVFTFTRVQ